jgi:hypothetical protein
MMISYHDTAVEAQAVLDQSVAKGEWGYVAPPIGKSDAAETSPTIDGDPAGT